MSQLKTLVPDSGELVLGNRIYLDIICPYCQGKYITSTTRLLDTPSNLPEGAKVIEYANMLREKCIYCNEKFGIKTKVHYVVEYWETKDD